MDKEQLIQSISQQSGVPADETRKIIDCLIEQIKARLVNGEKVNISGFGTFQVSEKNQGKIPQFKTGQNLRKNIQNMPPEIS